MFSLCAVPTIFALFAAPALAGFQDFGIPPSDATVDVKAFNVANFTLNNLTNVFLNPVLPGREDLTLPMHAFLIEHKPSQKKFMFDLGMRNDPQTLPPAFAGFFSSKTVTFDPFKDITQLLQDGGVSLDSIEGVFWRYGLCNIISYTLTFHPVTLILTTSVSVLFFSW
jgi:hypothetical protein